MEHRIVFNSDRCPNGEMVNLAAGYISLTEIEFINEHVTVNIEAKTGDVDLYDAETKQHFTAKTATPSSGDEKFSEVKCVVEGERIKLGFPQYTYQDNYPHCDGEYDRWTKTVSGFHYLCYDFKSKRFVV